MSPPHAKYPYLNFRAKNYIPYIQDRRGYFKFPLEKKKIVRAKFKWAESRVHSKLKALIHLQEGVSNCDRAKPAEHTTGSYAPTSSLN